MLFTIMFRLSFCRLISQWLIRMNFPFKATLYNDEFLIILSIDYSYRIVVTLLDMEEIQNSSHCYFCYLIRNLWRFAIGVHYLHFSTLKTMSEKARMMICAKQKGLIKMEEHLSLSWSRKSSGIRPSFLKLLELYLRLLLKFEKAWLNAKIYQLQKEMNL